MSQTPNSKYRPVLTQAQINHILHLCRKDSSTDSLSVIGTLAQFEYKIRNNAIKPSHVALPTKDLSADLGFTERKKELYIHPHVLYEMWVTNASQLSTSQLETVRHYRYQNNIMNKEEEIKYEEEILGIPPIS